jgi:hypothetical protein
MAKAALLVHVPIHVAGGNAWTADEEKAGKKTFSTPERGVRGVFLASCSDPLKLETSKSE